jgi:hypothetical protein
MMVALVVWAAVPIMTAGEAVAPGTRVVLPPAAPFAGPVTVTGYGNGRCLGAWSLSAGSPGALFGLSDPGEVTLKWKLPGGAERSQEVVVEEGVKTVLLTLDDSSGGQKRPTTSRPVNDSIRPP